MTTTNTPERATARPWKWDAGIIPPDGPERYSDIYVVGEGGEPTIVARINDCIPQGSANANLIIEAVNTHDALQAENERLREQVKALEGERDKLTQSYRCYSCKQVFEEDHGHGLASEHFGSWLKGDRPKCEDCLRGTATWGGGAHDPFYRVRKEAYEQLIKDSEALKRLRAKQEADSDDNALWS